VELPALGLNQEVSLTHADGMIGMIPVFRTKVAAKRYAGKKFTIVEVRGVK